MVSAVEYWIDLQQQDSLEFHKLKNLLPFIPSLCLKKDMASWLKNDKRALLDIAHTAQSYLSMQMSVTSFSDFQSKSHHRKGDNVHDTWQLFDRILTLFKPLNTQLSTVGASHHAAQTQAMSLMLLLYNLLTLHPIVCPAYLHAATRAVRPMTVWPNPHGEVALVLLTALEMELKAPGSAMWKRVLADVPVLSQRGQHVSEVCRRTIAGALLREKKTRTSVSAPEKSSQSRRSSRSSRSSRSRESTEPSEHDRLDVTSSSRFMDTAELKLAQSVKKWELISSSAFIYVASSNNRNAQRFVTLWKKQQQKQKQNQKKKANQKKTTRDGGNTEQDQLNTLRRHLILSTLSWDLDLSNNNLQDRNELVQRLQICSSNLLTKWFATTRQALSQSSRLPTSEEAQHYRVMALSQLLREMMPDCIPKVRRAPVNASSANVSADEETHRRRLFMRHHKGVELQFRPISIDSAELLESSQQLSRSNIDSASIYLYKYHPFALSVDVVGTRNYLNYYTDFGDLDHIVLGARLPSVEVDAAGFVTNTPTSEKISKLRGDAAEYLASASSLNGSSSMPPSTLNSRRKSISAWSDNGPDYKNNGRFGSTTSTKKTRVARDIEHQRRAHYEHASNTLRRLQFSGDYMTDSIDQINPSVLRLAALGGNNVLHRLLCGYVMAQHLHAIEGDLDAIDMCMYVIPTSHSDLAAYIGRHDYWYQSHVLTPFRSSSEIWKSASPEKVLSPLLMNYLSEAKQTIPIAIFDCECWFDETGITTAAYIGRGTRSFQSGNTSTSDGTDRNVPDLTIPFCSRMTIGLHTQVALRQQEHENAGKKSTSTTSTTSWSQTLMDKKFGPRDRSRTEMLEIKYVEVGLDGIEKEPQTINDTFHVVAAMNIPAAVTAAAGEGDAAARTLAEMLCATNTDQLMDPAFPMNSLPDPTSHSLDVCFVGGHGNAHDILKKNVLKQHDVNNLNACLKVETNQVRLFSSLL
jgi:hypothetical protein